MTCCLFLFYRVTVGSKPRAGQLSPGRAAVTAGSGHSHGPGAAQKPQHTCPQVPAEVMARTFTGTAQQQPLGVSNSRDRNFPTSSRPRKFPSEKSTLASVVSFSQQLLGPSTAVLRFLRKRGSQKAAGGAAPVPSKWGRGIYSPPSAHTLFLPVLCRRDLEGPCRALCAGFPWVKAGTAPWMGRAGARGCHHPSGRRRAAPGPDTAPPDNSHFCIAHEQMRLNHRALYPLKILNTFSFI